LHKDIPDQLYIYTNVESTGGVKKMS
jgi:hypothetical protein